MNTYRPLPDRYNPLYESKINGDPYYPKMYRPDDNLPARHGNQYNQRYYPRYLLPREPVGGYTGRGEADSTFPDRRFRPSSYDSRYSINADKTSVKKLATEFNLDTRYPIDEIMHSARRPEPNSAKPYTPGPLIPATNKYFSKSHYPLSPNWYSNRFGRPGINVL